MRQVLAGRHGRRHAAAVEVGGIGHFDEPQCAAVCPVDNCCISDPAYPETTEVLLEKARTLNPDKTIDAAKVWSGVRN